MQSDERAFNAAITLVSCVCLVGCTLAVLAGCVAGGNGIAAGRHDDGIDGRFAYDLPPTAAVSDYDLSFGEVTDTETGIRYLVMYNHSKWSISGITPLLDKDGNVMVDERYTSDER
jgi:hypothetical protein